MFEAIQTETPLLVLPPFLEQEIHNAAFIEKHNFGHVFRGKTVSTSELLHVLRDEKAIKQMQQNMRAFKKDIKTEIPHYIMDQEEAKEENAS